MGFAGLGTRFDRTSDLRLVIVNSAAATEFQKPHSPLQQPTLSKPKRMNNQETMSSLFEWTTGRRELARELNDMLQPEFYDVDKAKEIIRDAPRLIEDFDVAKYGKLVLDGVRFRQNVDWAKIHTNFPVLFARTQNGKKFAIDGRHRIRKAMDSNMATVPSVSLTVEETQLIIVSAEELTERQNNGREASPAGS